MIEGWAAHGEDSSDGWGWSGSTGAFTVFTAHRPGCVTRVRTRRYRPHIDGSLDPSARLVDDERSDSDLLVASRGEPELFGIVYRRRSPEILRYLARQTGDAHVAADLLAETFATAFRKRRRFRPRTQPGQAWLYGIARIEIARYRRSAQIELRAVRKLGIEPPSLSQDDVARIEAMIDAESDGRAALAALDRLPPGERVAVEMRVLDDHEYPDVADATGTTVGAARVRVHRGLKRIEEELS